MVKTVMSQNLEYGVIGGVVGTIVVVTLVFFGLKNCRTKHKCDDDEEPTDTDRLLGSSQPTRPRKMSFNSQCYADGAFPERINVASPIINIAFYFSKCPSTETILEKANSLLAFDRFRTTPQKRDWATGWVFDYTGTVDVFRNHFTDIVVESESDLANELERIVALDLNGYDTLPLWHIVRLENRGTGVSCVLIRVHHVIGDGIALVATMSKLFAYQDSTEPLQLDIAEKMRSGDSTKASPSSSYSCAWLTLLFSSFCSFFEVLSLATSRYDSDIKFTSGDKRNLTMTKTRKTVYFPTVNLSFIKQLKKRANVTLNDVLLSATAGAIYRYCQHVQDPLILNELSSIHTRALIPIAFPRSKMDTDSSSLALKNKWVFISSKLPMNDSTPLQRLASCHASPSSLKTSPTPDVQLWVQNYLLPLLPLFVRQQLAYDLMSRHSLVFSNIPGIEDIVHFGNETLCGMQIIFPNILPQILLISYGGSIFCNMNVDTDLVKDAEVLLPKYFVEELKELAIGYDIPISDEVMFSPKSAGGVYSIAKNI